MQVKQFRRKDSAFAYVEAPGFLEMYPTCYIFNNKFHFTIYDSPMINKVFQVVAVWSDGVKILDRNSLFPESMWNYPPIVP